MSAQVVKLKNKTNETRPLAAPIQWLPFKTVKARDLSIFFRELYTMIHAGMTLGRALELQGDHTGNQRLRQIIRQMRRPVADGQPLSSQLARFPHVFSDLVIGLVQAGEKGGFLETSFQQASDYLEREYALRVKISRETFYPKMVAVCSFLIPSLPTLVLKGFAVWLEQMTGKVLIALPFVLALGVALYALRVMKQMSSVNWMLDAVKLHLPLFGKVIRRLALAKFSRALASLYSAGVVITEAFEVSARAAGNRAIARSLMENIHLLERGSKMSEVAQRTGHFPHLALQMMTVGEETGSLDQSMNKVADYFEAEADTAIHQMVTVLPIVLIIIVGAIVGTQVVQFYMGAATDAMDQLDNVMK